MVGDDDHSLRTLSPSKSRKQLGSVGEDPAMWEIGVESESEVDDASEAAVGTSKKRPTPVRRTSSNPNTNNNTPRVPAERSPAPRRASTASSLNSKPIQKHAGEEGKGLMREDDEDEDDISPTSPTPQRRTLGPPAMLTAGQSPRRRSPSRTSSTQSDDFGDWEDGGVRSKEPSR